VDADEQLGHPVVSNGLPLAKLHHAAFDAHLIGIDPDYRIHVSDRLLEIHDGPFLELGVEGDRGNIDRQAEAASGSSGSEPIGASVRAIQESRIVLPIELSSRSTDIPGTTRAGRWDRSLRRSGGR
jgi:hypothetical protein